MTDQATASILSDIIYNDVIAGQTFVAGRYEVLYATRNDALPSSGYYGAIFKDTQTNTVFLANRGTEFPNPADLAADISIGFGGLAGDQYNDAKDLLSLYKQTTDYVPVTHSVGHSLGGYIAQLIGITEGHDAITVFGSPGAKGAVDDIENLGVDVVGYDKSKITSYAAEHDFIAEIGENIAGVNSQTIDLNDQIGRAGDGSAAIFLVNASDFLGYADELAISFLSIPAGATYIISKASIQLDHYHSIDNYRSHIAGDYVSVSSSSSLLGFASTDNGDTINFYKNTTSFYDSANGSHTILYEHGDGNLYALVNNADGTYGFSYQNANGNVVVKPFSSHDDMGSLSVAERGIIRQINLEYMRDSQNAARELVDQYPDILNEPFYETLQQGIKDQINNLLADGYAIKDQDAQNEGVIEGGVDGNAGDPAGGQGNDTLQPELGIGTEDWNLEQLVHVIQTGDKEEQIRASNQLTRVIKEKGVQDPVSGDYVFEEGRVSSFTNNVGGQVELTSFDGFAQRYDTKYTNGNFQQQVIETVGFDGRTNTAQITLVDGLVNQLYRGNAITIEYPDNFVFGYAGGYVGDLVGQQLQNGELAHDIFVSAVTKTLGNNLGEVLDFLAAGNTLGESVFDPLFGLDGANLTRPDILDDLLVNLQAGVVGVVSGKIVDELGDAIGLDDGVSGEVFDVVAGTVTTGFVGAGLSSLGLNISVDLLFKGLDGGVYGELLSNGFDFGAPDPNFIGPQIPGQEVTIGDTIQLQIANAFAAYAGNRLAGEFIEPESGVAALFGSAGSALGAAIGGAQIGAQTVANILGLASYAGGPIGIAIGAFIGTIGGTVIGNLFGGDDEPAAGTEIVADRNTAQYEIGRTWTDDGGSASVAQSMANAAANGVNAIIEMTGGNFRRSFTHKIEIGYDGGTYFVNAPSGNREFGNSGAAIKHAALTLLKGADIVGGHAILMRAWHNSEAETLEQFQQDLMVAEMFQTYLLNPTAILALMMNEPESEAAQQWAVILQRAAEMELHLPHEKDIDGGWGELLAARGDINPEAIPELVGNDLLLTDPVTGEEITLKHVIGPGYEIIRTEGTDGIDNIQIIVDGPSITYTTAGPGDDSFVGHNGMDIFIGGDGDDIASGGDGNDWLNGGNGDDALFGEAGDDLLVGGDGNDTLIGGEGVDTIHGGRGDDYIEGNEHADYLYGGEGNDEIHGNEGRQDLIYGEDGHDTIYMQDADFAYGGKGNDTFIIEDNDSHFISIGRDEGHDVVKSLNNASHALLVFDHINANELYYERYANDLKISVLGENQSLTVENYFTNSQIRLATSYWSRFGYSEVDAQGGGVNTVNSLVSLYASQTEKISGDYNVLSDQTLAVIQSDVISHYRDRFEGGQTSGDIYWQTPQYYSASGDNLAYRNASSWNRLNLHGGAGNDFLRPSSFTHLGGNFYINGDSGNDRLEGTVGEDWIVGGLGNDLIYGLKGDDIIYGGHGDDVIHSSRQNDTIYGGAGNDTLYGQHDDDTIHGGDGDDTIYGDNIHDIGDSDNDKLYGDAGNDNIYDHRGNNVVHGGSGDDLIDVTVGDGDNSLHGDAGNDEILGGSGQDRIYGGDGDDIATGGLGDDWLYGGAGNDELSGGDGADILNGDEGDDIIDAGAGDDIVGGGDGNDILHGGSGNDWLDGGEGQDTAVFSHAYAQYALTANGAEYTIEDINGDEGTNTLYNLEWLRFSDGVYDIVENIFTPNLAVKNDGGAVDEDDILTLDTAMLSLEDLNNSSPSNRLFTLQSQPNNGTLYLNGAVIALLATFSQQDILDGFVTYQPDPNFNGSDSFDVMAAIGTTLLPQETFNITIAAVNDNPIAQDDSATTDAGVSVTLDVLANDSDGDGNTLSVQNVAQGSHGSVVINADNTLTYTPNVGFFGADNIAYTISDGQGGTSDANVEILVNADSSAVYGTSENDSLYGDSGNNVIFGLIGDDRIDAGKGADILYGGQGNDLIYGRGGQDELYGGEGADKLYGNGGRDILRGGDGNDQIRGGNGHDILYGDDGGDKLWGNKGSDTFVFSSDNAFNDVDQIQDFKLSDNDILDISDLLSGYDPLSDAIADFVHITSDGTDSYLRIDADGGGDNFVQIATLENVIGLSDEASLEANGSLKTEIV